MLLKVKGLKSNPRLHEFDERPKHLWTLGRAPWPKGVKQQIARLFKAIGIVNPMRQKLVEPHALAFGGHDSVDGFDLSDVNWELVVDYFTWEASAWGRDSASKDKAHRALNEQMDEKYGAPFNHQIVYTDGKTWY